ncbi:MAG: zinc metallopeptidase [Gammaproteobacteria bacterium]|nr:zinc metallopeptidase [Gammaproteobacteria bacterium]
MHLLLLIILLLALVVGPSLWVNAVMSRYRLPRDRYQKTGGELARELLDAAGLHDVRTETTEAGDHYDPVHKVLRLSSANYNERSLTAVTVAAHEVGHALQDAQAFGPLRWRTRLIQWVRPVEKVGAVMLMASPFAGAVARAPALGLLTFLGGILTLGSAVVVHALTLPAEFDASFVRALPLLERRRVLRPEDKGRARRLLTAAALTYVSGALQSLLNVARWWRILRR